MNLRKTKIICTMGPAVKNLETIKKLLMEGMNIARFNFSHGDHDYHKEMMDIVREASRQTSIPAALLIDTKGPEIRTGIVKDDKKLNLVRGEKIIVTTDEVDCTEKILSISYKNLPHEISKGKHIYIADGLVDLEVEKTDGNDIYCTIINGGQIGSKKNVNVVGIKTSLPAVTEQDVKDIIFGIEHNVDFIAASFIRKPLDVKEIRGLIDICDARVDIISKIENEEGLENIDEIIRVSNGIMVARGDLGVQIQMEEIPLVQKRIVLKCNQANKPVIVATQMLDSMINNPKPTRAEATDVANAIFDGADAIMLSGETASGKYPVMAVKTMHEIATNIEKSSEYMENTRISRESFQNVNMADTIARASYDIAMNIKADAILTPTLHGTTPKLISRYRPIQNIIAVTTTPEVQRKLLLYWGIVPVISNLMPDSDAMINNAIKSSMDRGYIKNFDKIVMVAGVPVNSPIMLNMIKVHLISNVLAKGTRGYGDIASGRIVKVNSLEEAEDLIKGDEDEILLAKYIDESFKPILKRIKGYILEEFSSISWEEVKAENPDIVVIAGAENAMTLLEDNLTVTLDGKEKLVYEGMIRVDE